MEKYKEIWNDPAKLEAHLKETWAIISKGEDSVTHEEFEVAAEELAKTLNIPGMRQPTEEEKAAAKKLVEVKLHLKDSKLLFKLESPKEKKKENYKLRNLSYWHFNYYY